MKIGLLIGALGNGGSERQLAELAMGLANRGYNVEVLAYDGAGSYDDIVAKSGARVRVFNARSRIQKIRICRQWMKRFQPDVAHGFMKRASVLAILSAGCFRKTRLVASDFSTATYGRHKPALWVSLLLFRMADSVVTQTETNRKSLNRLAPWLRKKTVVICNGVNTRRFAPTTQRASNSIFRFICVGSVYRAKNPVRVVKAVALLRKRDVPAFRVDWFGRYGIGQESSPEHREAQEYIDRHDLHDTFRFAGPSDAIEKEYGAADALLHVSLQEGIPNAVVEAMSCGLPIVVSRVSDLPCIVENGRNGYVCDEHDPHAIAAAMELMIRMPETERAAMAERSRNFAVSRFGQDRFVEEYVKMYTQILEHS